MHDRVVVHIAPINPRVLQPGDFYLQVAPFCDQSARIVVCSLLEEEGLPAEVVEETPVLETSYPCIFSRDWLDEINQGRHGTPLSQCLLATEQGVVRLPWERVSVPDFVDVPTHAGGIMASAPPSCPPLPPPLPPPPPLPHFLENFSSTRSFHLSPSKASAPKQYPVTIKNSILASSSHPSSFSVETRICPAKHGIAVSLCLVDTRASSSSRPGKLKETETEPKPVGLVSPNKWHSDFNGTDTAIKTSSVSGDIAVCKSKDKDPTVSENTETNKHKKTNINNINRIRSADHIAVEGEYIDILQANMLFVKAQSLREQQKSEMQRQPHTQTEPQRQAERQPNPNTQLHVLPTKAQMLIHSKSEDAASLRPNVSAQSSTLHHSLSQQTHPDSLAPSQCVRTVWFSEKPCTPCMRRRQGGKVSRAQELRCRYRDSYQAAIQNPVTFGQEREGDDMLVVVEEDGLSQCDDGQADTETGCNAQGMWFDPGMQHQSLSTVIICKESGEKNTVPYWKPGETNSAPCVDYPVTNDLKVLPEQTVEKNTLAFIEPNDAKTYGSFHNMNGTNSSAAMRLNTNRDLSILSDPQQSQVISAKPHRLPFSSGEISAMNVSLKSCERLQSKTNITGASPNFLQAKCSTQNRRDCVSDGRCSSLSTAVVDTSEKCELVLVEGQNIRRQESTDPHAAIPQLHVVKCKNSTAFRLVSPKINRRKMVIPGTDVVLVTFCSNLALQC